MTTEVGKLSEKVIALLGLPLQTNQPIFLGDSNIAHMQKRHPADYAQYGKYRLFLSDVESSEILMSLFSHASLRSRETIELFFIGIANLSLSEEFVIYSLFTLFKQACK